MLAEPQSRFGTASLRRGHADERNPRWHGSGRFCRPCITARQSTIQSAAAAVPATFSSRDRHGHDDVDALPRRPASRTTPTTRTNICRITSRRTWSSMCNRTRAMVTGLLATPRRGLAEDEPAETRLGYCCSPPPLPSSHSPFLRVSFTYFQLLINVNSLFAILRGLFYRDFYREKFVTRVEDGVENHY